MVGNHEPFLLVGIIIGYSIVTAENKLHRSEQIETLWDCVLGHHTGSNYATPDS